MDAFRAGVNNTEESFSGTNDAPGITLWLCFSKNFKYLFRISIARISCLLLNNKYIIYAFYFMLQVLFVNLSLIDMFFYF